jgi:hypothetical protein
MTPSSLTRIDHSCPPELRRSKVLAKHQTIILSLSLYYLPPDKLYSLDTYARLLTYTHNMADALKAEGNKLFAEKKFAESM